MANVNICFDCQEQVEKDQEELHKNCVNKNSFQVENFNFSRKEFKSVKIKENIFLGLIKEKQDLFDIELIKMLMNINSDNKILLFVFPDKESSNIFCNEKIYKIDTETLEDSGYAYILDKENKDRMIFLINKSKIDIDTIKLIVDINIIPPKIEVGEKREEKIKKIYSLLIKGYLKKLEINQFSEPDLKEIEDRFLYEVLYNFHLYNGLKKGLDLNPISVKNYVVRIFELYSHMPLLRISNYEEVINSFMINLKLSLILQALKGSNLESMISLQVKKIWDKSFEFKSPYNELTKILKILFDNFEINDLKSIDSYIQKIRNDAEYLIENISPVYDRFPEVLAICMDSERVLFKLQMNYKGKAYSFGLSDFFNQLSLLRDIEKKCNSKNMLFIIKQSIFQLSSEYAIIFQDKSQYESTITEALELYKIGEEILSNPEKNIFTQSLKWGDIVLIWSRLIYTSFCLKDMENFNRFMKEYELAIQKYPVPLVIKMSYFFATFWITENYDNLIKILENYEASKKDEDFFGRESNQMVSAIYLISKSFIDPNTDNKIDYLSKALEIVETVDIMPGSLQRDLTVIRNMSSLIQMFMSLCKFLNEKENSFFALSEFDESVNIAKKICEETQDIDTTRKWALKLLTLDQLIKKGDLEENKKIIEEFEKSNHDIKDNFKEKIKNLINFLKGKEKLNLFLNEKDPETFWDKVIYKISKSKLKESYPLHIKEVQELRDLDIYEILKRFKLIVQRDGVLAFWNNSSSKNELKNHAEEIGKSDLLIYLQALNLDPSNEEQIGQRNKTDIIIREIKGKKIILETKMGNSEKYIQEGLDKIEKYYKINEGIGKEIEAYYIIFIHKKDIFNDEYVLPNGVKVKTIKIDIISK